MKKTDLILFEMNNLDLYDLEWEQIEVLKDNLIANINIKQLEKKIHQVTLNLSQVTPPKFMADAKKLLSEDEERLHLIYMLNHNLDIFKGNYKNIKSNKLGCSKDSEKVFNFLLNTKEMIKIILDYTEFTIKEKQEQAEYLLKEQEEYQLLIEPNKDNK